MKASELKYSLSRDYQMLYDLLKSGVSVVGFTYLWHREEYQKEHLMLQSFKFKDGSFDLGNTWLGKASYSQFLEYCEKSGVQYFEPNVD